MTAESRGAPEVESGHRDDELTLLDLASMVWRRRRLVIAV